MTEITQEGWKNKALSMLLAQLTSYVSQPRSFPPLAPSPSSL